MTSSERSRRAARDRLPLHPVGSTAGSDTVSLALALVGIVGSVGLVVWVALQSPAFALAALGGVALTWPLRRLYQRLPTAQAMTAVLHADGYVRVALGRGSVRPLATRLSKDPAPTRLGLAAGGLIGLLVPVLVTVLAVGLDQPWIAVTFMAAVIWPLVELVVRLALLNRSLGRDEAIIGRPELGGWVAIWHREHGATWRKGVPADELADLVSAHPRLRRAAREQTKEALHVQEPDRGTRTGTSGRRGRH